MRTPQTGFSALEMPVSIRLADFDAGKNQLLTVETNRPEIFAISKISNFEWQFDLSAPVHLTSTDPCFGDSVTKNGYQITVYDDGNPRLSIIQDFQLEVFDVNNNAPRKGFK